MSYLHAQNFGFSAGQLTVNIPGSAAAGTQYHAVLKATTTNPSRPPTSISSSTSRRICP